MPSLGILILILQVSCAVHVIKRGHERGWLWIILLFPAVGFLAYLVVVLIPDMQRGQAFGQASQNVKKMINPQGDLRRYRENLDIADTVANRVALAEECLRQGMPHDAIRIYEPVLSGPYKDYPQLLWGLACAYFQATDYENTRSTLERLFEVDTNAKPRKERLLYACTLEALGDIASARREFATLCTYYAGPEAQYRYALMLKRQGEIDCAMQMLQDILTTAKRSPRHYRKLHRQWIARARRELSDSTTVRT